MNRGAWKAALVFGGVFLCGALVGGAVVKVWSERQVIEELTVGPGPRFERHMLRNLVDELGLTETQEDKVRSLIQAHRPRMEQIRSELSQTCAAPMREHKAKLDAEIRAVLTPEQRERFDALMAKQRERFPMMGPPPWRGRGHGWRGGSGQ